MHAPYAKPVNSEATVLPPADVELKRSGYARQEFALLNVARGIAALTVVPIHVVIHLAGNDGWTGVYEFARGFVIPFFFALTGFVLVISHRAELERGWASGNRAYLRERLRVFWTKRFVRLYPIYWLTTMGVIAVALVLPGAMKSAKFAPRYLLQSFVGWPPDQTLPILPQGWTVPFIMRCYLLFALAYFVPFRRLRWIIIALYTGVMINTLRRLGVFGEPPMHVNYLVDFLFTPFSWQFLWGMIAAWWIQEHPEKHGSRLLVVAALLLYATLYTIDLMRLMPVYDIRMHVFGFGTGILVYALAQYELGKLINVPWFFRKLGNASYSLYITHLPLVIFLSRVFRRVFGPDARLDSTPFIWLQVAICVSFAFVFHSMIEEPLAAMLSRRMLPQKTVGHA